MIEALQSTARRVMLKLYLTSDHVTPATGKTVAVTISKNGGAFGNPSAGATTATELSNGWYYVDLSTTDLDTLGDLVVRGTATACDDAERLFAVAKATNRGMTGIPDAVANANGGLPILSVGGTTLGYTVTTVTTLTGYTAPLDAAGTRSAVGLAAADLDAQLGALPTNAELATALGTADDAVLLAIAGLSGGSGLNAAEVRAAIGLSVANLDVQLAALVAYFPSNFASLSINSGGKITLADGSITDATFTMPAVSGTLATKPLGMLQQLFRRFLKRVKNDKQARKLLLYADDGTTILMEQSYTSDDVLDNLSAATNA